MEELRPTLVRRGATLGALDHRLRCHNWPLCLLRSRGHSYRDVPDHALVVGNPARQIGWMCKCDERLGDDLVCPVCGVAYQEFEKGLESKLSAS
jgi:UDP-2-acetamido-3-amino-2,3-dideoxy-glucuronate N-acetyltransferase